MERRDAWIIGLGGAALAVAVLVGSLVAHISSLGGEIRDLREAKVQEETRRENLEQRLRIAERAAQLASVPSPAIPAAPAPLVARPPEPEPSPKPRPQVAERIDADALGRAYRTNEVAADHRYYDHLLHVRGTVGDISKVFGTPYVTLKTSTGCDDIRCDFSHHEVDVTALVPGQDVVVQGKCYGKKPFDVSLRECQLVR
jgi:hypothetical protein